MERKEESSKELQLSVYEDCVFLMDEEQLNTNRSILQSNMGILKQPNWVILMIPTAGYAEMQVGGKSCRCATGQVAVCMLSDGFVLQHLSDDFAARTIGMNIEFTNRLDLGNILSSNLAVRRRPVSDIDSQTYTSILLMYDMLRGIIDAADNPYRFRSVELAVELFYYTFGYYLHRNTNTLRDTTGESMTEQFLQLLHRDFKLHRDLGHYASALCISQGHLSATISRTTGKPASYWVELHVVRWAKQQLEHSTLTVGQIADELHFSTQSHFGTYFKRLTGYSPKAFRKSLKHHLSA
ncbi:MAG: AraC family transcriptional regulator [Bacteroidales bacterium]|nr:AraC family transcriptional regulator [Bacteroidales bacterium]